MKIRQLIGLVAATAFTLPSYAVNFGDGGVDLQGVLDGITVAPTSGNSSVNVLTDEYSPDEYWEITASNQAGHTIIVELAGFAGTNKFGIYEKGNVSNKVELFDGADSPGLTGQVSLSFFYDGPGHFTVLLDNAVTAPHIDFSNDKFGYYLDSSGQSITSGSLAGGMGGLFYSDKSLNSDGEDHVATYRGTNTDKVQLPGVGPLGKIWTDNEFLLAWEDLDMSKPNDGDFTDFVVMVESVLPVPAPTTLALMGLGLLGLLGASRRRKV